MARQRKARSSPYMIKRGINDALSSEGDNMRPLVLSGNDTGGKPRKVVMMTQPVNRVVSVKDNLLKIQQLANPIDFLIKIQNGELIPVQYVNDEGEVSTAYQTASLEDRISVAKFMASKILPTLNVTKHILENDDSPTNDPLKSGRGPSFAQLVSAAAARANTVVDGVDYRDATEDEDGGQADDDATEFSDHEQPD